MPVADMTQQRHFPDLRQTVRCTMHQRAVLPVMRKACAGLVIAISSPHRAIDEDAPPSIHGYDERRAKQLEFRKSRQIAGLRELPTSLAFEEVGHRR